MNHRIQVRFDLYFTFNVQQKKRNADKIEKKSQYVVNFSWTFQKKIVHCALNSLANYDQALFSANFHVLSLFSAQLAYPYITRGGLETIFVSIHYWYTPRQSSCLSALDFFHSLVWNIKFDELDIFSSLYWVFAG